MATVAYNPDLAQLITVTRDFVGSRNVGSETGLAGSNRLD